MQGSTATSRHGVIRKRSTKSLMHMQFNALITGITDENIQQFRKQDSLRHLLKSSDSM